MVRAAAIACAFSVAFAPGCDKSSQDTIKDTTADAQKKAGDTLAKAKEGWENLKTEYAPQLDELGNKVAKLKEDAASSRTRSSTATSASSTRSSRTSRASLPRRSPATT
jgi:hypothetical protein